MVATHVLASRDPAGDLAFGQALAGGRAAALFAVLAGLTLALSTGRTVPARGRERVARSVAVAVRALLVAALGLALGGLGTGIAVILTYYGVLFLLGLPFVGLRAPALAAIAVVWTVVAPVASHLVRPALPPRGFGSPTFGQLAEPGQLLSELLFTGYYPAVPWLAYLLTGMALGRADLRSRRVQAWVAGAGAGLAVSATAVSRWLTAGADTRAALLDGWDGPLVPSGSALLDTIAGGMFGTTPTDGPWQWLLVVAPHSATPFDLAQTIGSALLVIGVALLLTTRLGAVPTRAVAVLFGAGTMTLTLYTWHLLMRTPELPPAERADTFVVHVLVLLGVGAVFVAARRRGPLEWASSRLAGAAAALVSRR